MGRLMQVLVLLVLLIAAALGSGFPSLQSATDASEDLTSGGDTSEERREAEDRERRSSLEDTVIGPDDAVLQDPELRDAGSLDDGPLDAGPLDAGPLDARPVDAKILDSGHMNVLLEPAAEDRNPSDISEGAATEQGATAYDNTGLLDSTISTGTISGLDERRDENNEGIDDIDPDKISITDETYVKDNKKEGGSVAIGTDYGSGSYYGIMLDNATTATPTEQSYTQQTNLESHADINLTREQRMTSATEVASDSVKLNRLGDKVGRQKAKRRGRFVLVRRNTTAQPSTNGAVAATQTNKIVFDNDALLGTEDYLKLNAVDLVATEPQNSLVVVATRPSLRIGFYSATPQPARKPREFRLAEANPSSAAYRGAVGPLKHSGLFSATVKPLGKSLHATVTATSPRHSDWLPVKHSDLFSATVTPLGKSLQSSVTTTSLRPNDWLSPSLATPSFTNLPTAVSPPHSALLQTATPVDHSSLVPPSTVLPSHYSEVYDTNNILVSGRTFSFQSSNAENKPQESYSDGMTFYPSVFHSEGPSEPPSAVGMQHSAESITGDSENSLKDITINESNNLLPKVVFNTVNNDKTAVESSVRQHQESRDNSDDRQPLVVAKSLTNAVDGTEGKRHKRRRTRGRFHTSTKTAASSEPRDVFHRPAVEEGYIQKEESAEAHESLGTGKRLLRSSYLLPPAPLVFRPRPPPRQYWTHPIPAPAYPHPPPSLPRPTPHHHSDDFSDGYPGSYDYGYGVADDNRGTYFGHVEKRDGVLTEGKYFVDLPDGRRMVVTYYADKTGYHPTVTYEPRPTHTVQEDQYHGSTTYSDHYQGPVTHPNRYHGLVSHPDHYQGPVTHPNRYNGPVSHPDRYPGPGNNYLPNRNGLAPRYPAPFPHVHYVISHRGTPNYALNRPYGDRRPSYATYPNSFRPSYDPNRNSFPNRQNNPNIGSFFPTQRPFIPENPQSPYTPISTNDGGQLAPNFPISWPTNTPLNPNFGSIRPGVSWPPQGSPDQPTFVSSSPLAAFTPAAVSPTIINRGEGNDEFRPIFVPNDNRQFLNERQALHDQAEDHAIQSEGATDPGLTSIEEHIENLHSKRSSASASTSNKPVFSIDTDMKFTTRNTDLINDTVNKN